LEVNVKRWDELLRRLPPGPVTGAEVGVWEGKMSFKLLERGGLTLYMVDRWEPPTHDDSYYTSGSMYAKLSRDAYKKVEARAMDVAVQFPGRAHVLKRDSVEAAREISDQSLDFVFIDADHSYKGVTTDIKAWLRKVKPGGLLCGHDYDHPDQGEVKRAVNDLLGDVETGDNRTWFWRVM